MRGLSRRLCAAVLVALLAACANNASVPDIPARLYDDKGLLVARLYVPGTLAWENAQVNIDGTLYNSSVRDGYVGIALKPGEHNFVQLRIQGRHLSRLDPAEEESPFRLVRGGGGGGYRAPTYIYTPGATTVVWYTTLSVNRKFVVESGKVTNLGLMVYLPAPPSAGAPSTDGKRFVVINVDNTAEMKMYLETNYPELMATIAERTPKLAPARYLEAQRLKDLRRLIAANEVKTGKLVENSTTAVAYGDAGTLVMMKRAADKKIAGIEVLDTGTLADIVDAVKDEERLLFLTSEGKLLSLESGKLSAAGVPFKVHAVRLAVFRDGSLAIIDNHMRVLRSHDHGITWTRHEEGMIDSARNDMSIAGDVDDIYVTLGLTGMPARILNVRAADAPPRLIEPPAPTAGTKGITGQARVSVRDSGLFMQFAGRDFFFRPAATGKWQQQSLPGELCKPIVFDDAGRRLSIECNGVRYRSDDSGKSWSRDSV